MQKYLACYPLIFYEMAIINKIGGTLTISLKKLITLTEGDGQPHKTFVDCDDSHSFDGFADDYIA